MKEGKVESNNRGLVILLCVLGVAIVGLAAGIVLIGGGNKAEEEPQISETQQSYEDYVAYVDEYNTTLAKAQEMLKQNPVDVDAMVKMYSDCVDARFAKGEIDRASSFVQAEVSDLLSGGFEREALDVLLGIDISVFDEPEQHFWYNEIISLAKELGENEVVQQYEPLSDATKAAYDASLAGTEAAGEAFEALKIKYDQGEAE